MSKKTTNYFIYCQDKVLKKGKIRNVIKIIKGGLQWFFVVKETKTKRKLTCDTILRCNQTS